MTADPTVSECASPRDALLRAASFASAPCSDCKVPVNSLHERVATPVMSTQTAAPMNRRVDGRPAPQMPAPPNRRDDGRPMNGGDGLTAKLPLFPLLRETNPPPSYLPHRKRKATLASDTSSVVHHHPPDTSATATQVKIGKTLLIAYFPWEASKEDISNEFSKVCNVKKVHLVWEKANVRPRCFGFVKFMSRMDAYLALDAAQNGLITLNDSRGHVWHLKAEWTRTRDMMDDDEDVSPVRQKGKTRTLTSTQKKCARGGSYGIGSCVHRKFEAIKKQQSADFQPAYVVLSQ
eukprot:GEMP01004940.1.p1 GENE.GEMP01004940.1~~GEMP01004940.1.p1  ORF type:complete len:292 (+),score=72.66 GEMP01004940.1:181-1056(+)